MKAFIEIISHKFHDRRNKTQSILVLANTGNTSNTVKYMHTVKFKGQYLERFALEALSLLPIRVKLSSILFFQM